MYKMIVCDLDETLLRLDRTIGREDVESIKEIKKAGIKFVPATGRGYTSVQSTLAELDLYDEPGEYLITYNGGMITENKDNRVMYSEFLPFGIASEIYRRSLNYDVCTHVYTKDMVYIYNLTEDENTYLANRMAIEVLDSDNIDFLKGEEIAKIVYTNTDRTYLHQIEEDFSDITDDLEVTYSSNRYMEFGPRGVSKGRAFLKLAEFLSVDLSETIAIGDNYNDLSMVHAAGLGIGVRNTVESIKGEFDYITEASCDECPVTEVIRKFVL